jgi:TolB-like protein/Tfp pilus assembly protein PilF
LAGRIRSQNQRQRPREDQLEQNARSVWRALDTKLDREVAVKILPADLAEVPERLTRFEQEARAVAALNHPNIVTIYSVERADISAPSTASGRESSGPPSASSEQVAVHFIVMELIEGKTLGQLLPEQGMSLDTIFRVMLPLIRAINAAHERDVVHRDLKPSNIMVSDKGQVKVLDFGLAKVIEQRAVSLSSESPTETLARDKGISGTLPYMSPEQVEGRELDHRSDIFSMGVILYEMATGQRPFRGDNSAQLLASILRDAPRPVTMINPHLPRQLERIVRHSVEKEPGRRFQTVIDLRNELEALKDELGTWERAGVDGATGARARASELRMVAVLPLDNLSGDPDQEFFADGMTEALITSLAKIGALKVISRTSVMRYKGVKKPLREIAKELGVGAIVEGSVLRAGERVRITAQLIHAPTDEHLWAEAYDRDLGDVLTLQSEVAQAIAREVQVKLTPQEASRLASVGTVNPDAHEACLRGRYFWHMRTPDAVKKGLECFQRAIALDANFAPAYTGIADSHIVDGGRFLALPPDVAYARAREAALKALELDDDLAEAHTSFAAVLTDYDWDWGGAEREYRRAVELNPSYVTAHAWYAEHLSRMGRHAEAINEAKLARELDPLSLISNVIVAWIQFFARDYDEAIEHAKKTLELDPNYVAAHRILGWAYEETGQFVAAIEAHSKAASLAGDSPNFRGQLGRAFALAGKADEARAILDELHGLSARTPISALDIALIYGALGEKSQALDWLEKAVDERSDHAPYLMVNPRVDALRSAPRFQKLLDRMGLPPD